MAGTVTQLDEVRRAADLPGEFITAKIIARDGECYHALSEQGKVMTCRKADSCLLVPGVNDLVLLWRGGREAIFIFGILIKESSSGSIQLPQETMIGDEEGTVTLRGGKVLVEAAQEAAIVAPKVTQRGKEGEMQFQHFLFSSSRSYIKMDSVLVIASKVRSQIGRITQRIRDSFRRVERIDHVRAAYLDQEADVRYSVRAGHAAIIAEQEVKIDGDKIHIG
jgi:hypothetical protein